LAFNYYNSTDFSISDYLTKALWNTNYTANNDLWLADTNTQLSDGDISAFGYIKDYTETDPYWLANYSDFLTISAWNDTGLIQDWNADGYIKDWNSTGFIKDWSYVDTDTWDTSWLSNWTAYNSSWSYYEADTDTQLSDGDISAFGYIKDYTETDPLWTANWTNVAFTNIEETFSGNVTLEGIKLEGDTTNHRIYDNATCIIMTGDTSELRIC